MAAPRSPGGSVNTIIPQSCRQCKCAGPIIPSGTPGPARNVRVTGTAPGRGARQEMSYS